MLNLLADLPAHSPAELFTTLLSRPGIRIERIVSHGHASPPDFWYDQDEHEWVLLIAGAARLSFAGEAPCELRPGSCLEIPPHRRHRVDWTTPDELTVWLAVHFRSSGE